MNIFSRSNFVTGRWQVVHEKDAWGQPAARCAPSPQFIIPGHRHVCERRAARELEEERSQLEENHAPSRVRIAMRPFQLPVFKDRASGILILHWSRQIGKSF